MENSENLEKDPAEEYIRAFITTKGDPDKPTGYRDVARHIGILPATVQQVMEGRNKAGRPTIAALYKHYEDFDLVMAMTGKPGNQQTFEAKIHTSPPAAQDGIDWEGRFNALEKKYDALLSEYQSLVAIMASKLKMSFSVSSGQTTVEEVFSRMVVSGFVQNELQGGEVKIIPLNSLNNTQPMYKKARA